MAVEEIGRLRNVAIVGQGGTGKTQLAEAILFSAGATTRLGRPDDGTALMDFEPEELTRRGERLLENLSLLHRRELRSAGPRLIEALGSAFHRRIVVAH